MPEVDCVIPVHEKDFASLGRTLTTLRQCCPEVRRIVVVGSSSAWAGSGLEFEGVEFFAEDSDVWPFARDACEGSGCSAGWLLQQLLKLYAPLRIPGLSAQVLVCDADVLWLQTGTRFLESTAEGSDGVVAKLCIFDSEACPPIRSAVDLHRYDDFVQKLLPGKETAVCHHMLLQREILEALMRDVEAAHGPGKSFWQLFLEGASAEKGRASEYELYGAYARRFVAARTRVEQLTFAVVADAEAVAAAHRDRGVVFLVEHSHLRGLSKEELQDREGVINGDVKSEVVRRMTQGQPAELAAIFASV
eukprot:TRINITY_DN17939_c0_g1_i4.p1 TRINITY_DN17939_c0_g1~~TRINITY_DN17939_c0_g1_i4.p1  ORF type:complete len:305 (-),score=78.00 TRINITY_DN17939_c0_g1_i4:32-946(-)